MAKEPASWEIGGQFSIALTPGTRMHAAKMGKTLFLAPWTWTVPSSVRPPVINSVLISLPLRIGLGPIPEHPMLWGRGRSILPYFLFIRPKRV